MAVDNMHGSTVLVMVPLCVCKHVTVSPTVDLHERLSLHRTLHCLHVQGQITAAPPDHWPTC